MEPIYEIWGGDLMVRSYWDGAPSKFLESAEGIERAVERKQAYQKAGYEAFIKDEDGKIVDL